MLDQPDQLSRLQRLVQDYETCFMGPLEQMKPWSMTGVEGVYRFLARVWRLIMEEN